MRFLSAKDEKEAILSGIWQTFNNFILRGWPWWIAGLASVVLLEHVRDPEMAYPELIKTYMPVGLRGLMIAGFLSAFLSTIQACFHEVASTFLNDLYRPYIHPGASERHYIWAARMCIIVVAVMGIIFSTKFTNLLGLFMFGMKIGAMHGIVAILRWFWWRLNGWADLVGNVIALPLAVLLHFDTQIAQAMGFAKGPTDALCDLIGTRFLGRDASDGRWAIQYLMGLMIVAVIVVILSYITPKDDPKVVENFYRRIRPYGWWKPVADRTGLRCADSFVKDILMTWFALVYTFLGIASVGLLFFHRWMLGLLTGILSAGLCVLFVKIINRYYAKDSTLQDLESMQHAEQHHIPKS